MKLLIILSLIFVLSINVKSQCTYTSPDVIFMADGEGTTYSWHAGLYNLSQIGAGGNITTISFRLNNASTPLETYNNQFIYMRHTSTTDYNGNQSYPGTSGFTLVWSGTLDIDHSGFYNITLSTPFNYNGTDILEVLFENKSGHYPFDALWFDRTDNSPSVSNGKLGAANDWSTATSVNTKRNFNLAIGFNTPDVVNCNSFELTLPIVLKQFSVAKNNENIYINWITASEINNDFFTIEHSLDGVNFTEIKRINGAGNCNREISYSFIDKNAKEGINYYRLKQTDFDGKYTYSKVQAVDFNEIATINVEVYPNPVIGKVLNIKTNNTENTSINIYNCIGEKMGIKITNKNNIHIIDVSNLPKGIYFVETRVVGFSEYKKILIQ